MVKKVFVDSNVVISSLISSKGASYLLLNQISNFKFFISNISQNELTKVATRLGIDQAKLKSLLQERFEKVHLKQNLKEIELDYSEYILDPDDAHIVAGAKESKVNFLIIYNTRHFKADKIKQDFNIIVMTSATLLQYLRSVA